MPLHRLTAGPAELARDFGQGAADRGVFDAGLARGFGGAEPVHQHQSAGIERAAGLERGG